MRLMNALTALLFLSPAFACADAQEWRFRVWLDDKEIGYHDFLLEEQQGELKLHSEANFEYKLLFVKLYEYLHENTETWQDGCLKAIESQTDANGKPYAVSGAQVEDRFILRGNDTTVELSGCIMSFAYWNPAFLGQERLLNTQNGKIVDVRVSVPEMDELEVRGVRQPAYRYRLEAGELDIRLWYSENDEWLALETAARGGRTLRYELL